jgi:hypothetical protein
MDDYALACGTHEPINPLYHTYHLKMLYIRYISSSDSDVTELLTALLIEVSGLTVDDAILSIYESSGFNDLHIYKDIYIENLTLDSKKRLFYGNVRDLQRGHYLLHVGDTTIRPFYCGQKHKDQKIGDSLIHRDSIDLYFNEIVLMSRSNVALCSTGPPKTKITTPPKAETSTTCIIL